MNKLNSLIRSVILSVFLVLILGAVFAASPSVNLIQPTGGETISSSTYRIEFNVLDPENQDLKALIVLDTDKDKDNGYYKKIKGSLDLENTAFCDDSDNNNATENNCHYDYSLGSIEGSYHLIVEVEDTDGDKASDVTDTKIILDTIKPQISDFSPENDSYSNKLNQVISCKITDGGSGLDLDSIRMIVESETYTLDDSELVYDEVNDKLIFNAGEIFGNYQVVNVIVEARDKAGHLASEEIYFEIRLSYTPPETPEETQETVSGQNRLIMMYPAFTTVYLEAGQALNVDFTFKNSTKEKVCGAVSTDSAYNKLTASMAVKKVCLNKGESTETPLNIIADKRAEAGEYTVKVKLNVNGVKSEQAIKVKIEENMPEATGLELKPLSTQANANKGRSFVKFLVSNNTSKKRTLYFKAENPVLMPLFEPSELYLDKNDSREIKLIVHSSASTPLGEYNVDVTVESDDIYAKESFVIELADIKKHLFALEFKDVYEIEKPETKKFAFNLVNLTNEVQNLELIHDSDLIVKMDQYNFTLKKFEVKELFFEVSTRETDLANDHNVTFYAFNKHDTVAENALVFVKAVSNIELSLEPEELEINSNDYALLKAKLDNKGDFDENIALITPEIDGIYFVVKEYETVLKAREQTEITVLVDVDPKVKPGYYDVNMAVYSDSGQRYAALRLNVIGLNMLEINSFPQDLKIKAGESKKLVFVVSNPTEQDIARAILRISNLPEGVKFMPAIIDDFKAGETRTVEAEIEASSDIKTQRMALDLELVSEHSKTTKQIKALFLGKGATEEDITAIGPLTGLATLGGFAGLGLIVLIVIAVTAMARKWSLENLEEISRADI